MPVREQSAAMDLVMTVWVRSAWGGGTSWARYNTALRDALRLAITAGLTFHEGDFKFMAESLQTGYWIGADTEDLYRLMVECGNRSAWKAYEKYHRPAFIFRGKRLYVGAPVRWPDVKTGEIVEVKVTSFTRDKDEVWHVNFMAGQTNVKPRRLYRVSLPELKAVGRHVGA